MHMDDVNFIPTWVHSCLCKILFEIWALLCSDSIFITKSDSQMGWYSEVMRITIIQMIIRAVYLIYSTLL